MWSVAKPSGRTVVGAVAGAIALVMLSGCTDPQTVSGNRPDELKIPQLQAGVSTKSDVVALLGSASSMSTFNDQIWYYVSQKRQPRAWRLDRIDEQTVVALGFDSNDVLSASNVYTLKDGVPVRMNSDTTPTAGRRLSIFEQLIGSIGRFRGDN